MTMRAIVVSEPGGVDRLELRELPRPRPAARELLVRNFAAGLNRADILQRRGLYPPPAGASEVLGIEFAGEVAELGPGAESWSIGDPVFGIVPGGAYAEYLAIDERLVTRVPEDISFDAAAALPEAAITAWENLVVEGLLCAHEDVLIHAGSSGVGTMAIQIARALGARVFTTARGEAKARRCRELGADRAIDATSEDFEVVVRDETRGRGVDIILDLVGAVHAERNARVLAERGRWLIVGLVGGSKAMVDFGEVLRRRLRLSGNVLRTRSLEDRIAMAARFRDEVVPMVIDRRVVPVLDRVYPFEEVRLAHERMESSLHFGKIVLRF
jgi:NADPH2:quinone reductase